MHNQHVAAQDPLVRFLIKHRIWGRGAGGKKRGRRRADEPERTVSHSSLAGGVVCCTTAEMEDEFNVQYARSLSRGKIWTLCERPTPDCMRLMVDIDMKALVGVPTEFIDLLVQIIQKDVIKSFFPSRTDRERRVVVCGAPIKIIKSKKPDDGIPTSGLRKTGVHLIWPELYLPADLQKLIRYNIVLRCRHLWGQRHKPCNSWSDVIDQSIYSASGLRLVGSCKTATCDRCEGSGKPKEEQSPSPSQKRMDDDFLAAAGGMASSMSDSEEEDTEDLSPAEMRAKQARDMVSRFMQEEQER